MRRTGIALIALAAILAAGCQTHMHAVGRGAQGADVEQARQWYCIWGLVPINELDTKAMAGAADYDIETEITFIDWLISIPGFFVTVNSRTVMVTK
ncbi:MAG: hypothetical protein JXR94_13710 [Candidatus Hydrogenedentes bacterium]|nr:hypothetical protein [Candidatus Hydrogenedentota bacterium]